jgi:D-3-phosphoglycerate dehydrogenase
MLYVTNQDKPGFIGALGSILAKAQINIANFNLGRDKAGGDAICLVEVDGTVPDAVVKEIQALPHVVQAKALNF